MYVDKIFIWGFHFAHWLNFLSFFFEKKNDFYYVWLLKFKLQTFKLVAMFTFIPFSSTFHVLVFQNPKWDQGQAERERTWQRAKVSFSSTDWWRKWWMSGLTIWWLLLHPDMLMIDPDFQNVWLWFQVGLAPSIPTTQVTIQILPPTSPKISKFSHANVP